MRDIRRALVLVFDAQTDLCHVRAGLHQQGSRVQPLSVAHSLWQSKLSQGRELSPGITRMEDTLWGWQTTQLVLRIEAKGEVAGYVVLEQPLESHNKAREVEVLDSLRELVASAFIKTHLVEELRELNEKRNEFLGVAAHELRNPLTVITGYVQLMLHDLGRDQFDPSSTEQDLRQLLKVTERMNLLTGDLLDIASIESGRINLNLELVNLGHLVKGATQFHRRLAQQKKIQITMEQDQVWPDVVADRLRLSEVIDNLLSNAVKYTYSGGAIHVFHERQGGHVSVHVQDNGQGLTPQDVNRAFRSYTRLSAVPTGGETSTGLGLAIIKKIVQLHGGNVSVKSTRGEGATFSFTLPLDAGGAGTVVQIR